MENLQPSKRKLLETALTLVDAYLPEEITGEMVIRESGISRGSLYHHFEDVSDLIEQAFLRKFAARIDEDVAVLKYIVVNSQSAEQLYNFLCQVVDATHGPDKRHFRFFRARLMLLSEKNDRFGKKLAVVQQRSTLTIADLFHQAQVKGFMNSDFDARAAATFIQAYTAGKLVDDVSAEPVEYTQWCDLIKNMMGKLFFKLA